MNGLIIHACFEKFPFPWLNKSSKRDASGLGEDNELERTFRTINEVVKNSVFKVPL